MLKNQCCKISKKVFRAELIFCVFINKWRMGDDIICISGIYTHHKESNPSISSQIKNVFANSYEFPIFAIGLAMNQAVHID